MVLPSLGYISKKFKCFYGRPGYRTSNIADIHLSGSATTNVSRSGCILTIGDDLSASIFDAVRSATRLLWADSRSDNKREAGSRRSLQLIVLDRRQSSASHDIRRRTRHHPKIPVDGETIERENRLIRSDIEDVSTPRWIRRSW